MPQKTQICFLQKSLFKTRFNRSRTESVPHSQLLRSRPGKPNQRKGQNEKFMNFAHFCEFWCFSLGKQARFTLNFCSGMPLRKVHELTFLWFGLPGPLLNYTSLHFVPEFSRIHPDSPSNPSSADISGKPGGERNSRNQVLCAHVLAHLCSCRRPRGHFPESFSRLRRLTRLRPQIRTCLTQGIFTRFTQEKMLKDLTFGVRKRSGGVGAFHAKGAPVSKVCSGVSSVGGFPIWTCPSFFVLFRTFLIFPGFSRFAQGWSGGPFSLSRPIKSTYEEQSRKGPRYNLDLSRKKWETPGLEPPV